MQLARLVLLRWWIRNRDQSRARMVLAALLCRTVELPLVPDIRFNLSEMSGADAVLFFRLRLPMTHVMQTFGRSRSQLCRIFVYHVDMIYKTWQ
ncbi:hypothetical protein ACHHYP_20669 [Achlya hypogyna]|uniref:Uncharacterized protein n=1 Tax=Achlya hypogyna TaxID=1202772 RepID=A0A1V9YF85_ACHHY|nr:hypothetical protein ACHHYP_20669 [Achlya hypogyna]